jgi:hypothetical protein
MVEAQQEMAGPPATTVRKGVAMTASVLHQCPKCELRFNFRTELEYHLREDHPQPEPAAAFDEVLAQAAPPATPTGPAAVPAARRHPAWRRGRLAVLLIGIASVLLVVCAAVFGSIPTAAIVAVAALALSIISVRRIRGHAWVPRR